MIHLDGLSLAQGKGSGIGNDLSDQCGQVDGDDRMLAVAGSRPCS
jgi:hypothetical protein